MKSIRYGKRYILGENINIYIRGRGGWCGLCGLLIRRSQNGEIRGAREVSVRDALEGLSLTNGCTEGNGIAHGEGSKGIR